MIQMVLSIETIQAGDQVIATNPDTFQTEEKTVVETYINKTTCIVKIFIQNEVICTTMNHPFYVKGQGFLAAGKLSIGDEIMNASGGSYPVECVELEERQESVYNFQVEDYHTYYVGENSILVHNDCPEDKAPTEGGSETINTLTDAQKSRLKSLENTINDHLTEGDFSGTLRDLQGNPVPNGKGGYFDHLGEMKDSYAALNKIKKGLEGSLKNPNLSEVDRTLLQKGLDNANSYILRIEDMFEPFGGIN